MAEGQKILLLILHDLMNNFIGQDIKGNFCLKAVTKIYLLNSFIDIKRICIHLNCPIKYLNRFTVCNYHIT